MQLMEYVHYQINDWPYRISDPPYNINLHKKQHVTQLGIPYEKFDLNKRKINYPANYKDINFVIVNYTNLTYTESTGISTS